MGSSFWSCVPCAAVYLEADFVFTVLRRCFIMQLYLCSPFWKSALNSTCCNDGILGSTSASSHGVAVAGAPWLLHAIGRPGLRMEKIWRSPYLSFFRICVYCIVKITCACLISLQIHTSIHYYKKTINTSVWSVCAGHLASLQKIYKKVPCSEASPFDALWHTRSGFWDNLVDCARR